MFSERLLVFSERLLVIFEYFFLRDGWCVFSVCFFAERLRVLDSWQDYNDEMAGKLEQIRPMITVAQNVVQKRLS